jgi:hypothetical protein
VVRLVISVKSNPKASSGDGPGDSATKP